MEDIKLAPTTKDLPSRFWTFLWLIPTQPHAPNIRLPYLVTVSCLRASFLFHAMLWSLPPSGVLPLPVDKCVTLRLQGHRYNHAKCIHVTGITNIL